MSFKANDSLTEQIAQYLGQKIIQGDMRPGERIQELRIASELEVSRGSVREALLLLQRRHLVDIFPRRGAVVASIGATEVADFFELWFMLLDKVVIHLAAHWQNDDLAPFFALMSELETCHHNHDVQGYFEHGVEFLKAIYAFSGNRYLKATLNDLLPLTQRCLHAILRAGKAQLDRTHRFLQDILKTIIARDLVLLHEMVTDFGQDYSRLAQASAEALQGKATA
ncbi:MULTISPECIES: GntR family transcriptional regulator [Gulbenkiania]|uniref:DNA-binding transcriptional regulator, GntR family n=2 Tax=Gulbenkiania TaxID=397456 RepID=A0A0K6H629_9NEIS|nr:MULTISPECIES: GntR family transcriptional regulator [Gulbenkiania]TCW33671.1 DNA-binding GntR family transcriptional regulator [Gulbenkiania mobilis]CUA86445.1 DNA-binding transcriptional regulator, GntR family [Gulbenkiania indica]